MLALAITLAALQGDRTQILERAVNGDIRDAEMSPDGGKLALCSNQIVIYDTSSWKVDRTIELKENSFNGIAWGPDGKWIAGTTSREKEAVVIFDAATGRTLRSIESSGSGGGSIAAPPDGKRVVAYVWEANKLIFFDVDSGKAGLSVDAEERGAAFLRFSADGKTLYSGEGKTLREIDPATGRVVRSTGLPGVLKDMRFHPNGREIVLACDRGKETCVMDLKSGEITRKISHPGDADRIGLDAEGKRIVVAGDDYSKIYEYASGKVLEEDAIPGGYKGVSGIFFIDGGRKLLAAIQGEGHVRIITLK
jgi:WD40 repeat protein